MVPSKLTKIMRISSELASSAHIQETADVLFAAHDAMQRSLTKRDPMAFSEAFRESKKAVARLKGLLKVRKREESRKMTNGS